MARTARNQRPGPLTALGAAAVGGAAAWYAVLMRPILAASAYGPICRHGSLLGPHCTACYGALAMAAAGLGLLAADRVRRPLPARRTAR